MERRPDLLAGRGSIGSFRMASSLSSIFRKVQLLPRFLTSTGVEQHFLNRLDPFLYSYLVVDAIKLPFRRTQPVCATYPSILQHFILFLHPPPPPTAPTASPTYICGRVPCSSFFYKLAASTFQASLHFVSYIRTAGCKWPHTDRHLFRCTGYPHENFLYAKIRNWRFGAQSVKSLIVDCVFESNCFSAYTFGVPANQKISPVSRGLSSGTSASYGSGNSTFNFGRWPSGEILHQLTINDIHKGIGRAISQGPHELCNAKGRETGWGRTANSEPRGGKMEEYRGKGGRKWEGRNGDDLALGRRNILLALIFVASSGRCTVDKRIMILGAIDRSWLLLNLITNLGFVLAIRTATVFRRQCSCTPRRCEWCFSDSAVKRVLHCLEQN
ncbi:unnamed protein product [Nesidiocoris tenuis]|uniref:Uncharacterized protein n=1 Tax=Nesidiocoris tenuis TaxID=355587 RepID=A0A6H5GAY2_9HEMI|nr:unnamed protein product [Nesidiocoris tenuis]